MNRPLVRLEGITKAFSGVKVLNNINFEIYPSEVHALVGENGAGKTTLSKIISGVYQQNSGHIYLNNNKISISSPQAGQELGIALIHQEPLSFPELNVTENIFIGHTRQNGKKLIDWKEKHQEARQLLDSLDVNLDERARVGGLSIADQQMVEIVSALSLNARLIIMDEPTSSLTPNEVSNLFKIMRRLQKQGKAIVFISHRLDEVVEISQRITVLRDGKKINTCLTEEVTKDDIIRMMIGREMKELIKKEESKSGEILLKVENITLPGSFEDVSFHLRRGEIVGVSGLVGAGRSEVARALFGITPPAAGEIQLAGETIKISSPRDAINNGIAYVPEERQQQGLFLPFSVASNMTFSVMQLITRMGWINNKKEKLIARKYINRLQIALRSEMQKVKELSGGNQQKVVLAKWLLTEPQILILDEPTRGIDIGVKAEVYKMINRLAKEGKSILMISSELPEILTLSDRILVMCAGRITGVFTRSEADEEKIMTAATKFRGEKNAG